MGTPRVQVPASIVLLAALSIGLIAGCSREKQPDAAPVSKDSWLKGDTNEKLETLAKHHRGFDVAMVEIGYRYNELYYAGKENNWKYAKYLAEKIKTATDNAMERRPKRRANAEAMFLNGPYRELMDVIQKEDASRFDAAFQALTESCNRCHVAEEVTFIKVVPPQQRLAPIGPVNP
jgi:hypothetical protein